MKPTNMKSNLLTITALAATVACATAQDSTPTTPNWGPDLLHYTVRENFVGTDVSSNATARVDFQSKTKGESERQSFDLRTRRLAPDTTYTLAAAPKGSEEFFEAAQFTTDRRGNARLRFRNNSNGNNGNLEPVPDALLPLTTLGHLAILDGESAAVMDADLTTPDRLSYIVKRTLEGGNGEAGLLTIRGTHKRTSFNLRAVNLAPSSDYSLAINDTVVQTYQSDARGRLRINSLTEPVESPLDIQKVQLLDAANGDAVVLETELP